MDELTKLFEAIAQEKTKNLELEKQELLKTVEKTKKKQAHKKKVQEEEAYREEHARQLAAGEIPPEEMKNVFNLGIGYCIVTSPDGEDNIHMIVNRNGLDSWTIGEVVL